MSKARRVAVIFSATNSNHNSELRDIEAAAADLRVEIVAVRWDATITPFDLVETLIGIPIMSALVLTDPLLNAVAADLARQLTVANIASICGIQSAARSGGLASYSLDLSEIYHQLGRHAAAVLRGTAVGQLPVILARKSRLIVNSSAARSLGISLSSDIIALADEVIE